MGKTNTTDNKFMADLREKLIDERELAPSTANLYLSKLKKLNNKAVFNSLSFLKKVTEINSEIAKIENIYTRKSYLTAIVSILNSASKEYQKINKLYKALLEDVRQEENKINKSIRTEKQKENWIEWSEIMGIYNELSEEVNQYTKGIIKRNLYARRKLFHHMLLSLYVLQPPRRNLDYWAMKVDNNGTADNTNNNYYSVRDQEFVFNVYKTARTNGQEKLPVNKQQQKVLDNYITLMNLEDMDYLLQNEDYKRIASSGEITKNLNRVLGKKISSSMLRTIYLTEKFGDLKEEMKETADAMGHSVSTQQGTYVKTDVGDDDE